MLEIRPLKKELCEAASTLESKYLSTAWSEKQLEEIVEKPEYLYLTAFESGELSGVGGVICASPYSCEIFTVAVEAEKRGKGIGKEILLKLIDFGRQKGADNICLEVEEGNDAAISLYTKAGFISVGVRKGFYHGKNAIIMTKQL